MDADHYNTLALEHRAEQREIKRHALAAARSVTNPVRRQAKYNAIVFPQITFDGLTEEELTMPY